ncbi:hypothetical protein COY26_04890 [Candidatus Woesearchaeota archaeon CG_4_10_14_0_2_um_filter_33_10]|nr:MAG: hypothetical protein COV14_02300 [Candidatus Woesearchaeota archaeon CG10_big_fil_rev_8_21_14_0_10_33_12]PIU72778.1 MAG: hypothetical protein COS79_01165 [Candidatus Woesearchaeota archaeon CG06_land_8_20_14_3_00_33_13]PIZ52310.1 MAG: hypothetical protein COY26_04890 [Candidatus Woesearchaeota archaeon CG_4_10_14_0_2_um_filter_33_10]
MVTNYNKSKETPKEDENKPKTKYFLKVTPRGDETIESLSFNLLKLKNKNFPFGEFNNYILINDVEPELGFLEFFPKSKDVNIFADKYKTSEQALNAAIKKLNKAGLDAAPFDLEALINKTSIRSIFYK